MELRDLFIPLFIIEPHIKYHCEAHVTLFSGKVQKDGWSSDSIISLVLYRIGCLGNLGDFHRKPSSFEISNSTCIGLATDACDTRVVVSTVERRANLEATTEEV